GIAFLCRGNMSVGVTGDDLMVRVGPDATDAALAMPGARLRHDRALSRLRRGRASAQSTMTVILPSASPASMIRSAAPISSKRKIRAGLAFRTPDSTLA